LSLVSPLPITEKGQTWGAETLRIHDPERFLKPSGKPAQLGLGLLVGSLALGLLWLAVYVVVVGVARYRLLRPPVDRGDLEFFLVPAVLLALGIPGASIGYRLLTGRRRPDGGLLSPNVLRVSGALLIVAPWLWVLAAPADLSRWWHAVTFTSAGVASWILAARRENRDAPSPVTPVTQRPLD
jgi:hypothetical protein